MTRRFKMEELDCALCAEKMQDAIKKIPGVHNAVISFMTQRLTLDADEDQFDEILKKAQAACRKVDRDCRILV